MPHNKDCGMEALNQNNTGARVIIIDDHTMLNELITSVVNSLRGFQMVGWAQTETEGLALCQRTQPDLVILDLFLSATSGFGLLDKLTRTCARARVIVFSGNLTPGIIKRVLAAGAFSLISKTATLGEFRTALLAVADGRTYFSPEVATAIRQLVTHHSSGGSTEQLKLSTREEAVLRFLAQGLSSREIASVLGVSVYTVANHRSRLMKKTGMHRAAQLSLFALRRGLLGGQPSALTST